MITVFREDDLALLEDEEIHGLMVDFGTILSEEPYHTFRYTTEAIRRAAEERHGELEDQDLNPYGRDFKKKVALNRIKKVAQHFEEVSDFLFEHGELKDNFYDKIEFLSCYGTEDNKAHLRPDGAKYSFGFSIYDSDDEFMFPGGMIFHPKHDDGDKIWSEGSWSIHT